MQNLENTVKAAKNLKIMVVGDLMLDVYIYGDVDRISPESPVPVLAIRKTDKMLGGAGNVLANLCALDAKPIVFAAIGNDAYADDVIGIAQKLGADVNGILRDESRPTTLKTRYLARQQHLLRTDFEKTHALSAELEKKMLSAIEKSMKDVKAVVLSDYGKGVLTKTLLEKIIAAAKAAGVPVLVDPKGHDYSIYKGADYVTPNRKELGEATAQSNLKTDAEITMAAQKLIAQSGVACVIATRSEDGMSVIGKGEPMHLRTQAREVFDVSGAGDTVIATLAAMLAAGADIQTAATIANQAAGIAVSKVGTAPVRVEELHDALSGNHDAGGGRQARLASDNDALEQIRKWQAQGLKVGFTNGCFDIVHKGHVNYLEQARSNCDRLVLALNSDASVKILKGPTRPINDEEARAAVMGSLSSVDLVVLFGATKAGEDNTPCALIGQLRPDIFFKGGDYTIDQLPEAKIVQSYGGEVAIMGLENGFSTTNIIAKSAAKG
jgi:D-beta-D-heptose 7-phosphate kinase / D-beta-D-heptose 1-phosphate adenosyltransferase